jgi:hypothetical protein
VIALRHAWTACLAALLLPAAAAAVPPRPIQLEPVGGSGWQASSSFELRWRLPAPAPGEPPAQVAAAHYVVRNEAGSMVVAPRSTHQATTRISNLIIPPWPGAYTAEVWLEDETGELGQAAETTLRFDDTRPGAVRPLVDGGWVGRAELPLEIGLTHPQDVPPPAGIRGYAVAIDRDAGARPCGILAFDRCSDAETDLRGGADDDLLRVPELSEGLWQIGAVAVSGSGMSSAAIGRASVRVDRTDPTVRILGAPSGWTNRPVTLRAEAEDELSGMEPDGGGGPFTAIAVDGATPSLASGRAVSATVFAEGIHEAAYYARDAAGNVADGRRNANGSSNPDPPQLKVRIDRRPPRVFLVGPAGPAEPETLVARVADPLSGPDPAQGEIGVRAAGSSAPFAPLPTWPGSGGEMRAHWRSDSYPRGLYEFQAIGYDAAGNVAVSTLRADGAALTLRAPVKVGASLECGLRATGAVAAAYGGELVGRLALDSGVVPRAARIVVVERFDGGGERTSRAWTALDGSFSLWLGPGPGRSVEALFHGDHRATGAVCPELRLRARPTVALRASTRIARVGGRPIVFSGRVGAGTGVPIPAGGLAVELQFRLRGGSWKEFRTLRSNRRGRFRYRYRFSDDDSRGVRFAFRAVAPTQSDWPFEPWSSRPVAVRGA